MIDEQAAPWVESWIDEAVAGGTRLLAGGRRNGSTYAHRAHRRAVQGEGALRRVSEPVVIHAVERL